MGLPADKKVSVFIVGEPKSGTTAMAELLGQHPAICMASPKEPNYFCTDFHVESDQFHGKPVDFLIRNEAEYAQIFATKSSAVLFGEGSTNYLYSKVAAKNIKTYNPNAKIIISLREPVSFLHSLHMQYVNETTEKELDFARALNLESERKAGTAISKSVRTPSFLFYHERIKYAEQIERFIMEFGFENTLIFTAEEFKADNAKAYKKIATFLQIDQTFQPTFKMVHESKTARFSALNKVLRSHAIKNAVRKLLGERRYTWLQKSVIEKVLMKKQGRGELSEELRKQLTEEFRPEVVKASQLITRDLITEWHY